MLATSPRAFRPNALAFNCQSPALIVIEAHSPATQLFSKHPIFLAKIFNDLQLAAVHPPGNGDQQKNGMGRALVAYSKPIIMTPEPP
jgi:hypothetical protein